MNIIIMMHKRKPRGSNNSNPVDELALAKSAAWAWYNHGSGSDGKPIREFDASRTTKIEPRPSRYKLEAIRKLSKSPSTCTTNTTRSSTTSCHASTISLLDKYEIDRISKQLDHYIESSHAKYRGGGDRVGTVVDIKNKNSKKKSQGFWLRSHAVVCGTSTNEVVESRRMTSLEYSWRRRPEKGRVAVAEIVGCRPRKGVRLISHVA